MCQPTALYRHFDAAGRLLYVGISSDPLRRLGQHKAKASWATQISNITISWFPTRSRAAAAERRAVKFEKPDHNTIRFVVPRKKVVSGLRHSEVLALLDHYNASTSDYTTIEGCAEKLNLTVGALRRMLWLPRGSVVTLSKDDLHELLLRVTRGPSYAIGLHMADCFVAKMPAARRKALAKARAERAETWERDHTRLGRSRLSRSQHAEQVSA